MAQQEELILRVTSEVDQARRDIQALEEVAEETREAVEKPMEVEAETDSAERSVDDLLETVQKLSAEEAQIVLAIKGAEIQQQINDIRVDLATLNSTPAEIDIQVSNLNQLVGDLDKITTEIKEIDSLKAEPTVTVDTTGVRQSADDASLSLGRVQGSADGAKSALANVIGNSVQDLGALGGVAGSAGVAIGQLGEYFADARLDADNAGKSFGSLLASFGPAAAATGGVAALGIGIGLISSAMEKSKAEAEALERTIGNFVEGMEEAVGVTEEFSDALDTAFEAGRANPLAVVAREFQEAIDPGKLDDYRQSLSLLDETNSSYVEGLADAGGSFRNYAAGQLAAAGANEELAKELAGTIDEAESYDAIVATLVGTDREWAEQNRTLIEGLEGLDDTVGSMNLEQFAEEFLSSQRAIEGQRGAVDEAIASTDSYTAALLEYIGVRQEANAADQEAATRNEQFEAMVERNRAAQEAARAETEAATVALEDFNEQVRLINFDPTVSDAFKALVDDVEDGTIDMENFNEVVSLLADQWGISEEAVRQYILQEADRQLEDEADAAEALEEALVGVADEFAQAIANIREMGDELAQTVAGFDRAGMRADAFASALDQVNAASQLDQGGTTIEFSDSITALGAAFRDLDAATSDADLAGLDIVPDNWEEVRNMPEELRPVLEAIRQFRPTVQAEMTEAFTGGGADALRTWAVDSRRAVVNEMTAAGASAQQIKDVLTELGLTEEQIEIFISVAGEEQARATVASLSGLISGLDPEIQLQITALMQTDPLAALELTIAALEAQGVEIPAELRLLHEQLESDIDDAEHEHVVTLPTAADPSGASDDIQGARKTEEDNPVTLKAYANTDAAATDIEGVRAGPYNATINAGLVQQIVQGMIVSAFLDHAARTRNAQIIAKSDNAGQIGSILDAVAHDRTVHFRVQVDNLNEVERQLEYLARNRTATITVNQRLGSGRVGAAI